MKALPSSSHPCERRKLPCPISKVFDAYDLRGRLLSSSYTPRPGDEDFTPTLAALDELFDRYQRGGVVPFDYKTVTYYGWLAA